MLGLFVSVDPITAYDNPWDQFNRYRYANNNPYKYIDPDGRLGCTGTHIKAVCDSGGVASLQTSARSSMDTNEAGRGESRSEQNVDPGTGNSGSNKPQASKQTNWPKMGAAALRGGNSGRLMASGLLKFGVGGAGSGTGVGAIPGVPTMAWGIWNLRSSANNFVIAGQLVGEASTFDSSAYGWSDGARVIIVGGLLPYGTLADDPGEPNYHQMIVEKAINFKEHPVEFITEMGSISP